MFQEKKIRMNQYLLTNNESFNAFLAKQDDKTILKLGMKYVSWEGKFLTLVNMDELIAPILYQQFEDFNVVYYSLNEFELSLEVARFLYHLDKKLFAEFYYNHVEVEEIKTDLIVTSKKERQNIIAEIYRWNFNDIVRMDVISAN
jgi:hypothetical protein